MKFRHNQTRPGIITTLFLVILLQFLVTHHIFATIGNDTTSDQTTREQVSKTDQPEADANSPSEFNSLEPGENDSKISALAARLLAQTHYLQKSVDDEISSQLLNRYLDALDPSHMVFLRADLDEFNRYKHLLDDLIWLKGDISPAYQIFNRFMERYKQQVDFVKKTITEREFDFTTDETYNLDRREAPRPESQKEAKQLWLKRLRYEHLQEKLNDKTSEEIIDTITHRYERLQKFLREYESEDILQLFLSSLAHVYDPHSDYMSASELENFAIGMKLSLFGIGARLKSENGYCTVVDILPGGPAAKSNKLNPNDRIVAVAQGDDEFVDIVDMRLIKAVELIRGPKGTKIRLKIIPADAPDPSVRKTIELIRDEIQLQEQEAKAQIIEFPGKNQLRLGIIKLPSFYSEIPSDGKTNDLKSTTTDVKQLIEKLKNEDISGLILDIRNNGGGALDEAISLSGLFIKNGPIVQIKSFNDKIDIARDTDGSTLYDGPLAILTSHYSASASEILSAAMQDYGRAVIVGDESTFGKGTVQQLIMLDNLFKGFGIDLDNGAGALKLTIRKFYRPNGESTQLRGVKPDISLPSINNYADVGEASFTNPLPWDTIESTDFTPVNAVNSHINTLKQRSQQRIESSTGFEILKAEIEHFKNVMADKTVSLNEEKRRKERKEAEERKERWDDLLKKQPKPKVKVFEISVEQATKDGLPNPLQLTNTTASIDVSQNGVVSAEIPDQEEQTPAVDYTLLESERILLDLIALSSGQPEITNMIQFVE